MAFALHERIKRGGFEIGSFDGCRVLLKNNALYPWFVIVPEVGRKEGDPAWPGVVRVHTAKEAYMAGDEGGIMNQFLNFFAK